MGDGPTHQSEPPDSAEAASGAKPTRSAADTSEQPLARRSEFDHVKADPPKPTSPWYRQASVVVSVIALLVSMITTYYGNRLNVRQSELSARTELGQLIQRLTALPKENADLTAKYAANPVATATLGGVINEENLVLAHQAADVIARIPDQVSAIEYETVAHSLEFSEDYARSVDLTDHGLKIPADPTTHEGLLRLKAKVLFDQSDIFQGRAMLREALGVWPDQPVWQQARGKANTELLWANLEQGAGHCQDATVHLARAREQALRLDGNTQIGSQVRTATFSATIECRR